MQNIVNQDLLTIVGSTPVENKRWLMMTSLTEDQHTLDIEKQLFRNANRLINSGNLNVMSMKLAEKFDNPFLRSFMFVNIFTRGHGSDAVTTTSLK